MFKENEILNHDTNFYREHLFETSYKESQQQTYVGNLLHSYSVQGESDLDIAKKAP